MSDSECTRVIIDTINKKGGDRNLYNQLNHKPLINKIQVARRNFDEFGPHSPKFVPDPLPWEKNNTSWKKVSHKQEQDGVAEIIV